MMRTTRTYAVLDVHPTTFKEIREKLLLAGYEHAMHMNAGEWHIDMDGIALRSEGGANVHGIGPDTDGGPNPDYVGETDTTAAAPAAPTPDLMQALCEALPECLTPTSGLAFTGRIVRVEPIERADRLVRAQIDCGAGGVWWGVIAKEDAGVGRVAVAFLQDAILPDRPEFEFMRKYHFRVRMQKLRGAPSEVLIMPATTPTIGGGVLIDAPGTPTGDDVTRLYGVTKFEKNVPRELRGIRKSTFPSFIPKTDEPNFQRARRLVEALRRQPCYITAKLDGSSLTVYRRDGVFGVCSRNMELIETDENAFWKVVKRYNLQEKMPDGFAIQAELVGPGIQGNPLGLTEFDMRAFQVYRFDDSRYVDVADFLAGCLALGVPTVPILESSFMIPQDDDGLRSLAEGTYDNGHTREGIVIRPMFEQDIAGERVSVKVLNLSYKEA